LTYWIVLRYKALILRWALLVCLIMATVGGISIVGGKQNGPIHQYTASVQELQHMKDGEAGKVGSSRFYIWEKGISIVPDYIWLGSGPDTFGLVFPHIPEEKKHYFNDENIIVDKAHNELLQILITMGGPAVLAYLAIVLGVLYRSWRLLRRESGLPAIMNVCLMVTIVSYLVQAFFNISVITVAPYFWMILGLCYARTLLPTNSIRNGSC
jgi:O-antigen ligase